jgi:ABC-type glycerol-3-phosphate transport system permease component
MTRIWSSRATEASSSETDREANERQARVDRLMKRGRLILMTGLLTSVAIGTVFPLLFTLNTSLRQPEAFLRDRFGVAAPPHFANFSAVWERGGLPHSFFVSLFVTTAGVVTLWIVGALAGYAFSKMPLPGRGVLFALTVGSLLIPIQAIMYPFFLELRDFHLLGSYEGLVIGLVVFAVPLTVFQFASYFRGLPDALIEAARVDGAGPVRILSRVIAPISWPVFASVGVINFVYMWNEFLIPLLIVPDEAHQPLMLRLATAQGQFGADATLSSAIAIVAIIPALIAFLSAQRFFVSGITAGATK